MPYRLSLFLLLLIPLLTAACITPQELSETGESPPGIQRTINPLPVFDKQGQNIDHPFLGGFNTPRPQFVDIDGDGDSDLFVQENSNRLIFFEHRSSGTKTPLQWQSDKFQGLNIGEWFRFADMDQDGDMDLLAEQPYSHIRYYRNEGSSGKPNFKLAADTLKDIRGAPIFSDRQNIPNVTDIDCDGYLDLFIGRLDGTVTRYESEGRDDEGIPRFKMVSSKFEGISIVKQFGTMHGANTLAFYDIDRDGDQDLFWGDFFEPGLLLIENEGTCSNPVLQGEPRAFPLSSPMESSGYNAPAFTDWGRDGDVDLFVGVLGGAYNASNTLAKNFYFYEQVKGGNFELQTRQFLKAIDIGNESYPATGDVDGDGDTDLLLANKIDPGKQNTSVVYSYVNRSAEGEGALHETGALDLPTAYHYAPALGDLNGDGLDDLLLGSWKGPISYYENTDNGFEEVSSSIVDLQRVSNSAPALGDLDSDGDLDLLVGQSGGGIYFLENVGTPTKPDFVLRDNSFQDVKAEHRSAPALLDVDDDDDLDIVLGTQNQGLLFFRNTGTPQNPSFSSEPMPVSVYAPAYSTPHFTDIDGDGKIELLVGGEGGGLFFYRWPDRF